MRKSEDAAILMQRSFNDIRFVLGTAEIMQNMPALPVFPVFAPEICGMLDSMSKIIFKAPETKRYPDVAAFAFWCRKASTKAMREQYSRSADAFRLGRGVTFHISPSNVAVNFAYSMAAALLAGNAAIVRLPSRDFIQARIIADALQSVLDGAHAELKPYVCLIKYGHNKEITDYLSSICDVRVIWGGDSTISAIRDSRLPARAFDITFADRYSICVINAGSYLDIGDKEAVAHGFYNDTFVTDQNACTSPKLIVWTGRGVESAKELFWEHLYDVAQRYPLKPVQAVDKLTRMFLIAEAFEGVKAEKSMGDNRITRVSVGKLSPDIMDYAGNSGFFIEYDAGDICEILPVCSDKCQTLSYLCDAAQLKEFITKYRPRGIDRVVPIGKAMDFSLVWDRYDLISQMSGRIDFGGLK